MDAVDSRTAVARQHNEVLIDPANHLRMPRGFLRHWTSEKSGALRPAVRAYLKDEPLTREHIALLRAYLRQWMAFPWGGGETQALRAQVEDLTTRAEIERWLERAQKLVGFGGGPL
jgi:hypothetical protein